MAEFNVNAANLAAAQNAGDATEVSKQNALMRNQMTQVVLQEASQAHRFNADYAFQIGKANAEYYRQVNTANTAAINTDNAINTANLFNLSGQARAELVQESRDIFDWANKNAESEKDRAYNLAQYAIQRNDFLSDMEAAEKAALQKSMGNFVLELFKEGLTFFNQSQQD